MAHGASLRGCARPRAWQGRSVGSGTGLPAPGVLSFRLACFGGWFVGAKGYKTGSRKSVSARWRRTAKLIKQIQKEVGFPNQKLLFDEVLKTYSCELETFEDYLKPRRDPPNTDLLFDALAKAFSERSARSNPSEKEAKRQNYLSRLRKAFDPDSGIDHTKVLSSIDRKLDDANSTLREIRNIVRIFVYSVINQLDVDLRFDWMPSQHGDPIRTADLVQLRRRFLFGTNDNFSAVPGMGNPFYPTQALHPAIRDQLDSITTRLKLNENIKTVDSLNTSELVGDWLSLGGPVNNLLIREFLGVGKESPLFSLVEKGKNAIPPVRFDILKHLDRVARGEQPVRDWELIVKVGDSEARVTSGEHLLITSVPDPYQSDARMVSLCSMYPAGTRATDLLLQDWQLIENINKRTKTYSGWQALIPVNVIGEEPIGLGVPEIFQIPVDFSRLREAVRARASN